MDILSHIAVYIAGTLLVAWLFNLLTAYWRLWQTLKSLKSVEGTLNNLRRQIPFAASFSRSDHTIHVDAIFAAGAILSVVNLLTKSSLNRTKKQQQFNLSVAGVLFQTKVKHATYAYVALVAAGLCHLLLAAFLHNPINEWIVFFLALALTLVHANQKVLEYRIANGLYGKTPYEARELIRFLLSHADPSDFTDGGRLKKILPKPEDLMEEEEPIRASQVARS